MLVVYRIVPPAEPDALPEVDRLFEWAAENVPYIDFERITYDGSSIYDDLDPRVIAVVAITQLGAMHIVPITDPITEISEELAPLPYPQLYYHSPGGYDLIVIAARYLSGNCDDALNEHRDQVYDTLLQTLAGHCALLRGDYAEAIAAYTPVAELYDQFPDTQRESAVTNLAWIQRQIDASDNLRPLLFIQNGYIHRWTRDSGIEQLTTEGFALDLALSPDERNFAYLWQPRDETILHGYSIFEHEPTQTNQICLWNNGEPDCFLSTIETGYLYFNLQWLDDGRLTWIEFIPERDSHELAVLYDPATGTRNVVNNMWVSVSDAGHTAFVDYHVFQEMLLITCCFAYPNLYLFDMVTGDVTGQFFTPVTIDDRYSLVARIVVQEPSQTAVYALYCEGQWRRLDLAQSEWNNAVLSIPEVPYMSTRSAGGLRIRLSSYNCEINAHRSIWEIIAPDGSVLTHHEAGHISSVRWQISPDNQQIATISEDKNQILIWHDGEWHAISGTEGTTEISWSNLRWFSQE
ncbi:MAG: hypothetical protein OHK0046_38820 [Anaerolineae bacterium]